VIRRSPQAERRRYPSSPGAHSPPVHATSRKEPAGFAYLVPTVVGVGSLLAIQTLTGPSSLPLRITIVATGGLTISWWRKRREGRTQPSRRLVLAGRAILAVMTVVGFAVMTPDLLDVLGRG
jgi:hypothetical protein